MASARFTTYERVQSTALLIAKRDGQREDYNREKLTNTHRLEGAVMRCKQGGRRCKLGHRKEG